MKRDGGWIELVEPRARAPVARAHLMVDRVEAQGWHAELASLRLAPGRSSLDPGHYIARYARGEAHVVDLDLSPVGAGVRCDDGELPAALREVSEGE